MMYLSMEDPEHAGSSNGGQGQDEEGLMQALVILASIPKDQILEHR